MELTHCVKSIEEVLEGHWADLNIYNIGFIQNFETTRKNVVARTVKEAKMKFAASNNVSMSSYIVAKKHDVVSLNDHTRLW